MTGHRPLPARGRTWDHERMAELDPEAVLGRFWEELRADPRLSGLMALVPTDRKLQLTDGFALLPAVMAYLGSPGTQLEALDAAAHAYLRAAGLHVTEE